MKSKRKFRTKVLSSGEIRTWKIINVKLNEKEYDMMIANFENTTCRSINEFGVKLFTGKPVKVYYRDQAYDEFVVAAIQLRKKIDIVLAAGSFTDTDKEQLVQGIDNIKDHLSKIYDHVRQNKNCKKHR